MSHFIKLCRVCNAVISQCRCPSPNKTTSYGLCSQCTSKGVREEGSIVEGSVIDLSTRPSGEMSQTVREPNGEV